MDNQIGPNNRYCIAADKIRAKLAYETHKKETDYEGEILVDIDLLRESFHLLGKLQGRVRELQYSIDQHNLTCKE